jgi:hypothetical protein
MWQEIIVGLCVVGAALFLLRRWFFAPKKSLACGGCNGCDKPGNTNCDTPPERGKP